MSESVLPEDSQLGKRRSTRIDQAVPITVSGVDALGQPFKERTTTTRISAHGCKYFSKHYVPKNSIITIEVPHPEAGESAPRVVKARVIWVQRPQTVRELFQLGIDFEESGNIWGIAFPPDDWKEFPAEADDENLEKATRLKTVSPLTESAGAMNPALPVPATSEGPSSQKPAIGRETTASPSKAPIESTLSTEKGIHLVSVPLETPEAQHAVTQVIAEAKTAIEKTLRKEAQTAISEEMSVVRIQLDAQLHETLERAIRSSLERVSEAEVKKVVQATAKQAAAVVEQAKKDMEVKAGQIDQQLRQSIKEAAGVAAKHNMEEANREAKERLIAVLAEANQATEARMAAIEDQIREAAKQAISKAEEIVRAEAESSAERLKNALGESGGVERSSREVGGISEAELAGAVQRLIEQQIAQQAEQAVERAVSAREELLRGGSVSSELQGRHADWRSNIEESALAVQNKAVERARAQVEEFGEEWRRKFDAQLTAGLQTISEKIDQASRGVAEHIQAQIFERKSEFEKTLNDVSERELKAGIEQAERLASELRDTTQEAVGLRNRISEEFRRAAEEAADLAQRSQEQIQRAADESARTASAEAARLSNGEVLRAAQGLREEVQDAAAEAQQAISEALQHNSQFVSEIRTQFEAAQEAVKQTIAQLASAKEQALQAESRLHHEIGQASQHATAEAQQALSETLQKNTQFASEIRTQFEAAQDAAKQTIAQLASAQEQALQVESHLHAEIGQASERATAEAQQALSETLQKNSQLASEIRTQFEAAQDAAKQTIAQLASAQEQALQVESRLHTEIKQASERATAEAQQVLSETFQQRGQLLAEARLQIQAAEGAAEQSIAQLASVKEEAAQVGSKLQEQIERVSERATTIEDKASNQLRETSQQALTDLQNQIHEATTHLPAQIEGLCREILEKVDKEAQTKSSDAQHEAFEALSKAADWHQKRAQANMNATLEQVLEQSSAALQQQAETASSAIASGLASAAAVAERSRDDVQRAAEEATQKAALEIARMSEELTQKNEGIREEFQRSTAEIQQALSETLQQSRQFASEIRTQSEAAKQAIAQLATAKEQALQTENRLREEIQRVSERAHTIREDVSKELRDASEHTIAETQRRMQNETSQMPAHVESLCRGILEKIAKEMEEKSTDTQHETFAALSKAADWHQKKAQTTMNSALERVLEQSSTALEQRAREISSAVASELDHYRRTYVDHGQAEMQDNAKELLNEQRSRLNEVAEMASATFTDRVNRAIHETVQDFEEESRATIEKIHADMEAERERAFGEFRRKISEELARTAVESRHILDTQFAPVRETWRIERDEVKRDLTAQLNRAANDSVEAYKERLENATNSWLAASAAMLVQNSEETIETLARGTEARLRDTCAQVLSGMGDILKERLLGLSIGFENRSERANRENKS